MPPLPPPADGPKEAILAQPHDAEVGDGLSNENEDEDIPVPEEGSDDDGGDGEGAGE